MERRRGQYDAVLEKFSIPLMRRVAYDLNQSSGELAVDNPAEVESTYRYPDLTVQAEFLGRALRASIEDDLLEEIEFLRKYGQTSELMRQIVDLPDRRLSLLIRLMYDHNGRLSQTRRAAKFAELTDAEVLALHAAFAEGFQTTPDIFGNRESGET